MSMFYDLMGADERRTSILEAQHLNMLARKRDLGDRLKTAIKAATVRCEFSTKVVAKADMWDNIDTARVELAEIEAELKSLGYKVLVAINHHPGTPGSLNHRGHCAQHLINVSW